MDNRPTVGACILTSTELLSESNPQFRGRKTVFCLSKNGAFLHSMRTKEHLDAVIKILNLN